MDPMGYGNFIGNLTHPHVSKVTFPNLPPAQSYASPSRKLVLLQIDHNYTVGAIYVYISVYRLPVFYFISHGAKINQSFDLLELQRLHRKIHRSRTVQIHHSLVAGSVPRSWLNASLLAQRLVAGSLFLNKKKRKKSASYMPLSQLGMPSSSRPMHFMYSFFSFHIRSPAQCDVAGSIFSRVFVFPVFCFGQKN